MALENKLKLTSSTDLDREEERISKKKALWLFDNRILDSLPAGKFSTLQTIHKFLFDDIYDFAGKLRTINLAKGNFRFAPLMYLEAALKNIFQFPNIPFPVIQKQLPHKIRIHMGDILSKHAVIIFQVIIAERRNVLSPVP